MNRFNLSFRFLLVIFFVLFSTGNILAWNEKDVKKFDEFIAVINDNIGYNDSIALENINNAISFANKIGYNKGLGEAYYKRAIVHYYHQDYKEAEKDLKQSLKYRELVKDEKGIADVYLMQGIILDAYYQHDKAIEIFFNAIEKYKKINDTIGLSSAYGNIAISYNILKDCENALKYQKKSLELAFASNDLESIAISYYDMAMSYETLKNFDKAFLYYDSAEFYLTKANKIRGIATVLNSKGFAYKTISKYDDAYKCYKKAIDIHKKSKNRYGLATVYMNLGELKILTGKPNEAKIFLNKAKSIAQQINNLQLLTSIYRFLSEAHKLQNDYQRALDFYEKYIELKDSTQINETKDKMMMLQAYYNNKEQEAEIENLNLQNNYKTNLIKKQKFIILISILLVIISVFAVYLWYSKYKEKLKLNAKLNEQNKLIAKQKNEIERYATDLKILNEFKSKFYANISHELKTPLTLIISPLEGLIEKCTSEKEREVLELMHRNTSRLLTQINELIELAKIEKNELKVNNNEVDVAALIKGTLNNFKYEASRKKIQIDFTNNAKITSIVSDSDKLETIIINLVSNAIKYTPEKGNIEVALSSNNNNLSISIIDSGRGIESEKIETIFNQYVKVNDNDVGHGLGLNVVKEYVELLHGKISISSKVGEGTKVEVLLPLNSLEESKLVKENEITETNEELNTKEFTNSSEKKLILVVEDHEEMRNYIKENLSDEFRVITANGGIDGLKKASEYNPDCIISDVMMPDLDGFELLKEVKRNFETSHIPVILLTAKTSETSIIKGFEYNADDYLTKPFKISILKTRVSNLIRNRLMLQKRFLKDSKMPVNEISTTSVDTKFLTSLIELINSKIDNHKLDVNYICEQLGISRSSLHRKINSLTGQNTTEFIRTIRLKKAAELLKMNAGTVSEIAFQVGFDSLSYFTRCFKKHFNVSPSKYKG